MNAAISGASLAGRTKPLSPLLLLLPLLPLGL
jgi:hypothetical protein